MGILKDRAGSGGQYLTEVNRKGINMSTLTNQLNARFEEGWRLHSIFEQGGNTITVFERRDS